MLFQMNVESDSLVLITREGEENKQHKRLSKVFYFYELSISFLRSHTKHLQRTSPLREHFPLVATAENTKTFETCFNLKLLKLLL